MRAILVLLLGGWLSGCAATPPSAPVPVGDSIAYVVARSWHTDIGLSLQEISGPLTTLERGLPGARYLVFGFGERAYYMGHATGSGDMLTALLPSKSAILVTALSAPPPDSFDAHEVITLHLPAANVARIVDQLWDAFEKTPDGSPILLSPGPYPGSLFYAGAETYSGLYTCNTWTARILRDAGLPIDPSGALFVGQVMRQVRQLAARQTRGQ